MKSLCLVILLAVLVPLAALAQPRVPVPAKATSAQVLTGTDDSRFITPKALADAGLVSYPTNGITAATATNIANASGPYLTSIPTNAIDSNFHGLLMAGGSGLDGTALAAALASGTNSFAGNGSGLTNLNLELIGRAIRTNEYNVLDYGADPTGVNSGFETNIQAAINAASADGGGVVVLPPGLFTIGGGVGVPGLLIEEKPLSFVLSNNIHLRGAGQGLSVVQWRTSISSPGVDGFGAIYATNLSVQGITFDFGYNAGIDAVIDGTQFYYCRNLRFENCDFLHLERGEGTDSDYSQWVVVKDCYFENNGGGAIGMGGPPAVEKNGPYFFIGNRVVDCGTRDAGLWPDSSAIGGTADNPELPITVIKDCTILGGDLLINVNAPYSYISGCFLSPSPTNTSSTNVFISAGRLTITDTHFVSHVHHGAFIVAQSGTLTVKDSVFSGREAIKAYGLNFTDISGCYFTEYARTNNSIQLFGGGFARLSGNYFRLGANYGIAFMAPVTNSIISDSLFWNTSVSISTGSSNNVITGNQFVNNSTLAFFNGANNLVAGNQVDSPISINSGAGKNRFIENTLDTIVFNSAQDCYFENNIIKGAISGGVNSSVWVNNLDTTLAPLRNYTITTNYTADAIDSMMIFNGTTLTNILPTAITVNKRKQFHVKNINATTLRIQFTSGQTADGATFLNLPQWASATLQSDGSNWNTIGDRLAGTISMNITNSDAVTPNRTLYFTNQNGAVYRFNAELVP